MPNNNMLLWDEVCKTDPHHTKDVSYGGRKFTSIDAYSQIKRATEMWGPYGSAWGLKDLDYEFLSDYHLVMLKAVFFYPTSSGTISSFEISNSASLSFGKDKWDDEFTKKIETNTITKSLSRLGYNVDVFLGKFEDDRYVTELKFEFAYTPEQKEAYMELIESENALDYFLFMQALEANVQIGLNNSFPQGEKTSGKKKGQGLMTKGAETYQQYLGQVVDLVESGDVAGVMEIVTDLGDLFKIKVWGDLNPEQQKVMREETTNQG